jgi:hypothetical protein
MANEHITDIQESALITTQERVLWWMDKGIWNSEIKPAKVRL